MKKNIFLILFIFTIQVSFAQVGIGTITPDPSSMLDISSTTAGMLTPRMTTSQRNLISNPATGLLIYDTDDNLFYFYDGTVWLPMSSTQIRTNYKLVKSIADLADELAVGGGSKYILNENFLYEINGIISFDYPIDLNGAYIRGQDTGEDILLNNSGNTFFSGTKGGHIRDVLINGNGASVFNITGTNVENLILYSVVTVNASAIGSLNNLGVVFFNVVQYVNNNDGLDVSNINSFFAENVFWTETNQNTFLTLSGTYNNLQMANGRIVADTGEIGIDVSSNPTINNAALLSGLSFVGDGTLVAGYSPSVYDGYSFSNRWDVNCEGIPLETDGNATGDLNFNFTSGGGANTTFVANQTPVKLNGATTSNSLFRFTRLDNNRIVYDGNKTRFFNVTASISFEGNTSQDRYIFYVAKGNSSTAATVIDETGVWRRIGGAFDIGAVPLIGTVELSPGDYIEVWAERFSGSGSLFTVSLNLTIR